MVVRTFQARLLWLIVAVLALLEAGTLISVHLAGQRTMQKSVSADLHVGANVLDRILTQRAGQLSESLRILMRDFAFRELVASGDVPTISSALENQRKRVNAGAVLLVDLDGNVKADTIDGRLTGRPFPFASMLADAQKNGEAYATISFSNKPYQFVIVPVLAPQRIAWLCAGFEIDEAFLADVRRLTTLDISLWSSTAGLISTLPPDERADLLAAMPQKTQTTQHLGNADYATLLHPLHTGDNSRVLMLMQRNLAEARRPFVQLELTIFALSFIMLLAAVVAAVIFSRSVSRPLRVLAEGAGRVERGDYVSPIVVEQKDEIGQLATAFNQMQAAIGAREEQIIHQATHDALTGLPNRTLFLDRLSQSIEGSKRSGESVGMIMMDVDRFKEINDTLGHHFGDQLLIEIGRRLTHTLRLSDTVARLGGDEFAVKFTAPTARHATEVAGRVGSIFTAPFILGDVSIDVNASLGIALYQMHADDADTLMKRADIAMYDAKKNHTRFAFYEPGRDEHSLRRLALMMELRQAVTRNELELHFQPKVEVSRDRAVHAEALVRWKHPRHGLMRPDEFIPLAEQTGNISLITKWVVRRAVAECAEWNRAGLDLSVAVNLSALDLFDTELPTFISGLLSEAGLPPSRLVLEITESAVMKDTAYALKVLRDLKRRGVVLAIDDFGTGYSSLAHLKRLPVDELKIDKSFVQNLSETATDDLVIVRSTIELGHNMGLVVIAEGVESQESWQILKRLGCDMGQGYFMSPPLPAAEFRRWCERRAGAAPEEAPGLAAQPQRSE
ncbi:MAG TPA: EAL domain-containing protein [Thermoanaerobaculia bacterium]|nr:EAL domain-containing protein [Thermoanaerobaculia bacterium]